MKKIFILFFAYSISAFNVFGQEFNKSINKDSLLKVIVKDLPDEKKNEFIESYNSGNEQTKEFLLFMLSMPKSSKKELIENIDLNYNKLYDLKTKYAKSIPNNYQVSIEFNSENNIVNTKETIDIRIIKLKGKETIVNQEWNLKPDSKKLKKMLAELKWTNVTVATIKKLLIEANCISIQNGQITEIGYARSGMGKYSYLLFDKNLTATQIKKYNNDCEYIYYKNNIVLEYGGGAIGPQCFPD